MIARARYVLAGQGWPFAGVLLFGALLNGVFSIVDPLVLKLLVDRGLLARDFQAFLVLAVAVVLLGIAVRVGLWAYELLAQRLKNGVTEAVSLRMLQSLYGWSYGQFIRADSGYFLSRIYDEPAKVAQGAIQAWIGAAVQAVSFLAAACVAFYLSWKITLLLSLVVPLLFYLANRFQPRIEKIAQAENEEEARLRASLGTAVQAYTTVRLFGLQDSIERKIRGQVRRFLGALYARVFTATSFDTLSKLSLSLAEVTVLLAAGYGVVSGSLTIGGLFGFLNAFWKVIGSANRLIAYVPELARMNGYIGRLQEFEASGHPAEGQSERDMDGGVAIEKATFRYDGKTVLDDFSLVIKCGERVLLAGPNGSGKSTLAYLMAGLLEPERGVVRAPALTRISAMLTPFHFAPGSLKDNVDFDRLSAAQKAMFQDLAEELGLAGKVDQDASELSAGERKKAQLIMTLLKEADLYIFDEPLANVDVESKQTIVERQLERAGDKTLVTILHGDEKYYPLFDRVVLLEGSRS